MVRLGVNGVEQKIDEVDLVYVDSHDEIHLAIFSDNRLRYVSFDPNDFLRFRTLVNRFAKHPRLVHEQKLTTKFEIREPALPRSEVPSKVKHKKKKKAKAPKPEPKENAPET